MSASEFDKAEEAAKFIRQQMSLRPRVGLVLGSGLGAAGDTLKEARRISYGDIPHFPVSTAVGHAGCLLVGCWGEAPVAVMQGRVHFYEGYSLKEVVFPIRVLGRLGVRVLLLTSAAGAIKRQLKTPALLLIRDHLNLQGSNPLLGRNEERFGPRFPDMTEAYSKRLRMIARQQARQRRVRLYEGVYAALHGPSYETPAEIRALAGLGADVVGMSTVPEVIAARHMGLEVLGISCVTNLAAGISKKKIDHEEVLEAGERMARQFAAFLQALIPALARVAA